MKIAVICPDYPSERAGPYAFVHARVKLYQQYGQAVQVFVNSRTTFSYEFEGVSVTAAPKVGLCSQITRFSPDVLAVFYPMPWMVGMVARLGFPKVVWVLGHELLWNFRLMSSRNVFDWVKKRIVVLPRLAYQIWRLREFIRKTEFSIFVSAWLHNAAEKHALCRFKNAVVIPNPVDTRLFSCKVPKNIKSGISLRSLERSVYGLDIAIKAFSEFDAAKLTIIGRGRFFRKYERMVRRLKSNTTLLCEYKSHDELPNLYHEFGFFVAPSREETQGLAMCEAMACGLPVVATNVGGIPEFVRDGVDGYLVPPNDPEALRQAVTRLISDEEKYFEMSQNARSQMESVCAPDKVINQEIEVMRNAVAKCKKNRRQRINLN